MKIKERRLVDRSVNSCNVNYIINVKKEKAVVIRMEKLSV